MSTNINQDNDVVKSYKNCCKFKYRIRWFNSKGVGLILLWTTLVSASTWYYYKNNNILLSGLVNDKSNTNLKWVSQTLVIVMFLVSAPISGWLADTKLGVYKVFKTGIIFVFIASVLASVQVLLLENLPANSIVNPVASWAIAPFIYIFGSTGAAACFITAVQLGIDQMPDACTASITSYIAWFVFCFYAGAWFRDVSYYVFSQNSLYNESADDFGNYNIDKMSTYNSNCTIFGQTFRQTFSLFPVLCMTVVLCLDFLFSQKWLIIEPKSTQSLKLIFRVLKFAAKHKAPVNRSALTYWEENIPSRIDLGKSRYGGPFTTEQVEDVKTIFKLIAISLPFFIITVSLELLQQVIYDLNECNTSLDSFTCNNDWCVLTGTLVYEFAIYPLLKNKVPSLLKSFGILSFIIIALSIVPLSLSIVEHFDSTLNTHIWNRKILIIVQVIGGFLTMFGMSAALQFGCAQSPYSMRTIVTGCATLLFLSSKAVVICLEMLLDKIVSKQFHSITLNSLATGVSIVGFVLHCLLARWYKGRVRDDVYTPHRLVEEVYERYLSSQTEHS